MTSSMPVKLLFKSRSKLRRYLGYEVTVGWKDGRPISGILITMRETDTLDYIFRIGTEVSSYPLDDPKQVISVERRAL